MDRALPSSTEERDQLRKDCELRKLIAETELKENEARRMKAQANASRVYTFYGGVNATSVENSLGELGRWSRENPGAPITIVFNSPGGYVDDGLALYDYIIHLRQIGHHVTTITMGRAASMAGVLLQAGDVRIISPNAMILVHEVSAGASGKLSEMSDSLNYLLRLQNKLVTILASRSKLSEREIKRRWKKTDWWLDANEAIKFGLADGILGQENVTASPARGSKSSK